MSKVSRVASQVVKLSPIPEMEYGWKGCMRSNWCATHQSEFQNSPALGKQEGFLFLNFKIFSAEQRAFNSKHIIRSSADGGANLSGCGTSYEGVFYFRRSTHCSSREYAMTLPFMTVTCQWFSPHPYAEYTCTWIWYQRFALARWGRGSREGVQEGQVCQHPTPRSSGGEELSWEH